MCSVIPVGETQPKGDGGTWWDHNGPPGHGLQPHPEALTLPELTGFSHSPTRAQPQAQRPPRGVPVRQESQGSAGQTVNKASYGPALWELAGFGETPTAFPCAITGIFMDTY